MKVSEKDHKEFRAPKDHRGHRALRGHQDQDYQDYQESRDLLVLKVIMESGNLACQDCLENQEHLDYLDLKVTLVLLVGRDQLDFLGLQGFQVLLGSLGLQNQEVRDYLANQVILGSQVKKVYLGSLVRQGQRETEDLAYLVCQD